MTGHVVKISIGELAVFLLNLEKTKNLKNYQGTLETIEKFNESMWNAKIHLSDEAQLEVEYVSSPANETHIMISGNFKDEEDDNWALIEGRIWVRNNLPEVAAIHHINMINEREKINPCLVREVIDVAVMQDREIEEVKRFSGGFLYSLKEAKRISWEEYKNQNT